MCFWWSGKSIHREKLDWNFYQQKHLLKPYEIMNLFPSALPMLLFKSSQLSWPECFLSILQRRKHAVWTPEICPWLCHEHVAQLELETTGLQRFCTYICSNVSPEDDAARKQDFEEVFSPIPPTLHLRAFQNQVLKRLYRSHTTMSGYILVF